MKIDLTWGESVAVREQFLAIANKIASIQFPDLAKFNYTPFDGDAQLIEHTRAVIRRQMGRDYKYVILTNGAAGGCVIAMRAYKAIGYEVGMIPEPPFFSLYPSMVRASGLQMVLDQYYSDPQKTVYLVDNPSNPEGQIRKGRPFMPTIWDAVYSNRAYTRVHFAIPHDVLVGSYSKLTGLNGIRIGWIATDDPKLYDKMKELTAAEYCGLSIASTMILNSVLPDYDWERFERNARGALDANRSEWSKLEKFFGDTRVLPNGMFYYGPMDAQCKELFTKADVIWTPSTKLGTFRDDHGRFNIGASHENIKKAVEQVLWSDKIARK